MAEENRVTLHGFWASFYSKGVELALRAKKILFEYVEEDLMNKSQSLLKYNPVHKKVPVLVHNGKPVAESLVILEYIEEKWNNIGPRFLPQDPYKRAQVRFWVSFIHQQLFEAMILIFSTEGEAQEKAGKYYFGKMKELEEGMRRIFPDCTSVSSSNIGLIDIVLFSLLGGHKAQEEVLGLKVLDREKNPLLFSWVIALSELPLMKELIPVPHDQLVQLLHGVRNNALKFPSAKVWLQL
ncbi:hypothetical protein UlMin_008257 [Ulmus minor]